MEMTNEDLSSTIAMTSRARKAGRIFTEVSADHARLQDAYARKSREYENIRRRLTTGY